MNQARLDEARIRMPTSYALVVSFIWYLNHKCTCRRYELASSAFIVLLPIINEPSDTPTKEHPCLTRWGHGTRDIKAISDRRYIYHWTNPKKGTSSRRRKPSLSRGHTKRNPKIHPHSLESFSSVLLFPSLFYFSQTPLKGPKSDLSIRGSHRSTPANLLPSSHILHIPLLKIKYGRTLWNQSQIDDQPIESSVRIWTPRRISHLHHLSLPLRKKRTKPPRFRIAINE